MEGKSMFLTEEKLRRRVEELEGLRYVGLTGIAPLTAMEGGLGVD